MRYEGDRCCFCLYVSIYHGSKGVVVCIAREERVQAASLVGVGSLVSCVRY
jgi:hypothetical protein